MLVANRRARPIISVDGLFISFAIIPRPIPAYDKVTGRVGRAASRVLHVRLWRWSQLIDATLYLKRKDGVSADEAKIWSRVQFGREAGVETRGRKENPYFPYIRHRVKFVTQQRKDRL